MAAKDYIRWIRSKVGHEKIILTFTGGCIFYNQGKVLLQRRGDSNKWGFAWKIKNGLMCAFARKEKK